MARGVSVGPNGPTFELPPIATPPELYQVLLALIKTIESLRTRIEALE